MWIIKAITASLCLVLGFLSGYLHFPAKLFISLLNSFSCLSRLISEQSVLV